MNTFFTLCSNNYLAQATVLGNSVKENEPDSVFIIVLVDKKTEQIDYSVIPFEVLPIASIEPRTDELAAKYNIIELNTCVKPRVIEYLFTERNADRVIYLDPDIRVYAALDELNEIFDNGNVAVTPHALTPTPADGKGPTEAHFLRFGIFNFGFIALKRCDETLRLAKWWKDRTYEAGYIKPEAAQFVDQIYGNLMPILFSGVAIIRHEGYNMAPWNLHERVLRRESDGYWVTPTRRLAFFHFSSFKIDSGDLPVHHYDRYSMKDRPDLAPLYSDYNEALKAAGYFRYRGIPWAYAPVEKRPSFEGLRRKGRALGRMGVMWAIRVLPTSITDRLYQALRDTRA